MASVVPTITQITTLYGHVTVYTWAAIGDADTCVPVPMDAMGDRSVHVYGTFGGATISIKGSNEPNADPTLAQTNFVALHDPQGVALTMTAAKIEEVSEVTHWLVPSTASGSGSAVTVQLLCRGVL